MQIDGQAIALVLAALGGGATAQLAGKALWSWITGKPKRERDAIAYERTRADNADRRADAEASHRRRVQEYASELRGVLLANGIDLDEIPGWPDGATTHTRTKE